MWTIEVLTNPMRVTHETQLWLSVAIGLLVLFFVLGLSYKVRRRHVLRPRSFAFYHPYCSSGGGGERVLWKIVEVLSRFDVSVVIYTLDSETDEYKEGLSMVLYGEHPIGTYMIAKDLLRHVQERFDLSISLDTMSLSFVHLPQHKHLLNPAGSFSLLQESIGTMRLAWLFLREFTPSIYVDTTGAAFSFLPAYVLFGCRVVAYVHYPTISTDMLRLVWKRRFSLPDENRKLSFSLRSYAKLVYYILFACLYGAVGSLCTTMVLVNSTWTYRHIRSLWRGARDVRIVYPPCRTLVTKSQRRESVIVSLGQFRPEKDHVLQIRSFTRLQELHPECRRARLVLMGSCRNTEDADRLDRLRQLANDNVSFVVNEPFEVIQEWLGRAQVGLHTMWNEHFGIGVVEMMAAGLIVVAHNSGGPQTDIVAPGETGFLAATVDEYAECLRQALTMEREKQAMMRRKAAVSAERFTDDVFDKAILQSLTDLHVS